MGNLLKMRYIHGHDYAHMREIILHKRYILNPLIIVSFILIAFISGSYLFYSHIIFSGNGIDGGYDMMFHFQRIMDLTKAIKGQNFFPSLTFNSMSCNANAMMQLYPYFTLYPIAMFFLYMKPTISSIYLVFMILMFVALLVSYFSSLSITKNRLISYTFSILYCLSSMMMFYAFEAVDIGALMAMIFLPISIFGYVNLLKNDSWIQLTIGMILLTFSHVLTTLILTVTLIIWTLCSYKQMNIHKWINLFKSGFFILLTTAIWWLPSLDLILKNQLEYPNSFGLTGATDIVHLVTIGLHNSVDMADIISFFAVIGLLLLIIFWKRLDRYVKQFAIVAIISLGLTTNILPWGEPGVASWIVLTKTPLSILQFPWRLDMIPELCLSYILAFILVRFINFHKLLVPSIIIIAIIFQISNQLQVIHEARASKVIPIRSSVFYHDRLRYTKTRYYINKNKQLKYVLNSPTSVSTIYDYYPVAAMPMNLFTSNGFGSYKGTKIVKIESLDNGLYKFKINPKIIYGLNLPIVEYNTLKYKTYLDGKPIKNFMGQDHLLVIPALMHGFHHLYVKVIYPHVFYVSRIVTLLGVVSIISNILMIKFKLCIIKFRNRKKRRRID
ncbi:hypothetical protein [Lentilactobacillus parakefiri]|nr:hypothetical protein [Lentilactobacillus parakefiri]